jgi:hypothetical protein
LIHGLKQLIADSATRKYIISQQANSSIIVAASLIDW